MNDFYEVGKTYESIRTTTWKFRVDCITTHPEDGSKTALGWRYIGDGEWEAYSYEESDWEIFQTSRRLLGE